MNRIDYIRQEEKKYHGLCYEQYKLFEIGSGVGRNSIPIAQKIRNTSSTVTCVELLNSALTKLQTYSKEHDVFEVIKTKQAAIEN